MDLPSATRRRRAVTVAGHTGDVALALRRLDDPAAAVRIAALRALGRLGRLTDDHLGAALTDPEGPVRVAALELAADRGAPSIEALLDDVDDAVVETAAWACGERADSDEHTVARLAAVARSHDDPLVRETAVAALGAIGHPAGLAAVLAATEDKPAIRRRAVVALAAFDGPEVDAAWARARHDRDRQVRDAVDELVGPVDV